MPLKYTMGLFKWKIKIKIANRCNYRAHEIIYSLSIVDSYRIAANTPVYKLCSIIVKVAARREVAIVATYMWTKCEYIQIDVKKNV